MALATLLRTTLLVFSICLQPAAVMSWLSIVLSLFDDDVIFDIKDGAADYSLAFHESALSHNGIAIFVRGQHFVEEMLAHDDFAGFGLFDLEHLLGFLDRLLLHSLDLAFDFFLHIE